MKFLTDVVVNIVLTTPLVGAYAMFALGIVFIYRASKVLNLAHGAMAMFPAYLFYAMAGAVGTLPAAVAAVIAGGALGLTVERVVVRRLRAVSSTAQVVGTVAVLGLLIAIAARIWGTTPIKAPSVFPEVSYQVGEAKLQLGSIGLFVVSIVVTLGFMALFRFTDLGLAMRAAASNRRAAALMGIDADRTTALAWLFAGVLAALGGVLLGASTNLHPFILSLQVLPAFVAALIGGLENVTGAFTGSLIVGLTVGVVPTLGSWGERVGTDKLVLAILAFAVMSFRGAKVTAGDVRSGGL